MKAVILAGGLGTRLAEETTIRPKPMVEIGDRPILWHIMKIYSSYGINEFVICLGYRGYMIKEYFANYYLHTSDVTFDVAENRMQVHHTKTDPWTVTLIDTGTDTMTGGRLRRVLDYVGDEDFCFTYGDGVADIDMGRLIETHRKHGTIATVTAVQPLGRFGSMSLEGDRVTAFTEKPAGDDAWINGGFFVVSPGIRAYLEADDTVWEREPLQRLAAEGQLTSYRHTGFWQPMDTLRERDRLQELWQSGAAPWKTWGDT
jgi:glucose-1-phosphate cytidylyltransferase